jgi:ATP phosphoribosyltransferase regulatory subunit
MATNDKWLLPEGIEELPPPQAAQLEQLRRKLLDCYAGWGYELVMPPFIEYLDSLQTDAGQDLDRQTFKLTDPLSGRMMGVRADMTLQAARIDSHLLKRDEPVRLCYLGTVLHAFSDSFGASRAPLQIGAELYGHAGIASDLEVIEMMLETLKLTGLDNVYMDLGHVGIYRALAAEAGLDSEQEARFFDALQRKAVPEVNDLLAEWGLSDSLSRALSSLPQLNGGDEVLDEARICFAGFDRVLEAVDGLQQLANDLAISWPDVSIHFDLAELRGYRYQTGVVFAAFIPGHGQEVARGGRYDEIGKIFGRARPATGFSADLKVLIELSGALDVVTGNKSILAPPDRDVNLMDAIRQLREDGEIVIQSLPGQGCSAADMGCDRELVRDKNKWVVVQSGQD